MVHDPGKIFEGLPATIGARFMREDSISATSRILAHSLELWTGRCARDCSNEETAARARRSEKKD